MMRCEDGNFYVVKFRNNPQHMRVLANEMLATRLAEAAGLPCPATEIIVVKDWLVEHTTELNIQLAGTTIRCQPGLHFGSRYVVDPLQGQVFDDFPTAMLERVRNLETFAGMLVLDKSNRQRQRTPSRFLAQAARAKIHRSFYRPGLLFQRGRMELPRLPYAWSLRA